MGMFKLVNTAGLGFVVQQRAKELFPNKSAVSPI